MREVSSSFKWILAITLVSPMIASAGCGGNGGEAELKTYEAVTTEEQEVAVEKMERLKDEPRG